MAEDMILDGGIMIATAAPAVQQIVYLDFDGELTSYNGEILTIDHVAVEDSGLNTEDISAIADKLNEDFADRGVIFVTERPADGEFSTIYIGRTSAFEKYGNFAGLAETIDAENLNKSDNAFVMLKGNESTTAIADTIAHEVEHIVFGMTHTGSDLAAYAEDEKNPGYIYYYYSTNHTYTGTLTSCLTLSHYSSNRTYVSSRYRFDGGDDYVCKGSHYDSASDVTINSGVWMDVEDGGVANSTTFIFGYMYISSGGVASDTTVNTGGYMHIYSGGVANDTTVNTGGSMYISSGGTALEITENGGYVYVADGAEVTFASNTFSGLELTARSATVHSGTTAVDTTILNPGGRLFVYDGGVANNTTVNSGGGVSISGGVANNTTLNGGGSHHNSAALCISSGGVANNTTVNSGGFMYISSGGVANNTTLNGGSSNADRAALFIFIGGVANSTTVNSYGSMCISSGGVANNTTLNGGSSYDDRAALFIFIGGVANDTTVNTGGSMYISSGGVANDTTVNSGGYLSISSGGTALKVTENGGYVYIADGAEVTFVTNTLSGLTLSSGNMTVHSNTVANNTTLNSGGNMYISSGGVANSTTFNSGGWMGISSGGVANSTTFNSGGWMGVSSGGVANSTTVNSGGWMRIYSGGSHTGRLQISGGIVSAFLGAVIDFNIADYQEADEPLINDWTRIVGHDIVTYCITVSDKQAAGEYQLVGNAANFAKTITVCAEDGSQHGELSLTMEEPLEVGKISLLLKLNEETNIVSVVVNSDFSSGTDRENKNTQVSLPESAFNGMTCKDYTLEQAPDWLTIDPNTGKLSGTTGKITDTATGYGTTEVVITGTKDGEEKKHTIELVVVPENIAGDGKVEESVKSNMTDLIAEAVENREERSSDPNLLAWMPFPEDKKFAWNYCGLDIELSGAAYGIAVTDNDYVISVQGKLSFTIFDSGKSVDERASLTVDFTGDKYIKVTTPKDFESVEFDIVGEMVFKNLALSDGFFLKEGVISVDTEKDIWSGTAEIDFVYFDKTIEAEYKVVEKQVDTLTIEVSGLDIAVGTTGFFIESIGGGVENLSDGDDEPSTIVAQMGLYYGKQVTIAGKTYSLITADLEVEVTNKSITGSGDIEVLGGIISGNVGVTVDWQEASFSAQGSTTLANLATVQGAMKIDCRGNITYSASSILDFSQYGLGVSSNANILLNFSNDGDYSNDYYAAWSSREFCGMQQSFGLRFNLDGSWELLGTQSVKAIEQNSPATYSLRRSVPPVTQSWDFTGVNGTVLISVQWKSGETEFMLTDGSGNTYTLEDIRQRSDMEIIENAGNANSLLIAVKDPADGIWTMSAANGTDTVISANVLTGNAVAATPQITVSAGENRNITVNWSCSEIPENAELCIYYDSDNSGNDGILIAQITPETAAGSLNWTVPDVISGNLYFYAVLSSPELLPAVSEYTDSIAMQSKAQLVEVDSDGWTYVAEGFYAQDAVITAGGILEIDGGALSGQNFIAKNSEIILDGATVSGSISIAGSMAVKSGIDASNLEITLDLTNRSLNDDYLIDNIALLEGISDCSLLVSPELAFGEYKLSEESDGFTGSFTIGDGKKVYGNIAADGDDLVYNGVSYQLKNNNGDLVLSISPSPYRNLTGNANGISWNTTVIGANHIVEYSSDNFTNSMRLHTSNNQIDTWGLPSETWQWRIKENNADNWTTGPEILQNIHYTPNKFVSDKDGDMDVFFANASGSWESGYAAQHLGILNSWSGTNEQVILTDKNKLADIFEGSSDANILLLTDDANGDALFVDDIYTALPGTVAEQQARIANLDEIRAGAGDDVVDMTSQRFNYIGDGVTIYGGDGDDVIWSNKGNNKLFGDAGNDHIVGASGNDVIVGGAGDDRMHGGGGDDIFCFGSDWGIDTVDQLSGGTVTLWFEDGSEENWNADTRTYTDGENTVTVSGTADVTLKFGGDISSLPEGIFSNAVTKKIFESTLA